MSQEIEFKFGVEDESALDRFARVLGLDHTAFPARRQRNTFFDSADGRLRYRGLALRLRVEEDRAMMTIKGKGVARSEDRVLLERFEAETAIDLPAAEAILDGSRSPLTFLEASADDRSVRQGLESIQRALQGRELVCLGSFENRRTSLPAVSLEVGGARVPLVFELDRTLFPGGRLECEIEAEIQPGVDAAPLMKHLLQLLERAEIHWSPTRSKFARFLDAAGLAP
jgi:uncharacterized protein YjbK